MKSLEKNIYKNIFLFSILLFTLVLLPLNSQATPSAMATYSEINLGGGLWEYDYTLTNTSDPVADSDFDIYDFGFDIDPPVTLSVVTSPTNWEIFTDSSTFIIWFSPNPGAPPFGDDITPGTFLSGFNFTSDTRLASLTFEVTMTNPFDPEKPGVYREVSSPAPAAVPEPAILLLLGSGFCGIMGLKWKFKK